MPEPEKEYVALKQILLGDQTIRPGEPVPILPGRSYHHMLSLGQIAEKPEAAPAALPAGVLARHLYPDTPALFVDAEGMGTLLLFLGLQVPDEEARVALGLAPGQSAALVRFPDDPEALLVAVGSLLPQEPTATLLGTLEAKRQADLQQAAETASRTHETAAADLREQVAYLELLLTAVRTPGEPLAEDQPGGKDLAAVGITTREGLQLLASGEHAAQNLIRLEGIGKKTAAKILATLDAPEPPAPKPEAEAAPDPPETPPEG